MPKTKIAFFEVTDVQKEYLKSKLAKTFEIGFFAEEVQNVDISKFKDVEVLAVFVGSAVTKDILGSLPKLKLVTTMSTGFDHIDLEAAKTKSILVCNVPTYGENTVAEHAFALILTISRRIIESNEVLKKGDFTSKGLQGFDLKGKTIGIVGCGNIGVNVAHMAYGFGMKILGFDLHPSLSLEEDLGMKFVPLEELFAKSDIISLHLPLNEHTQHIVNRDSIFKMKKGVVIINTARGPLIETDALYDALVEERVAGAGLDVFEEEGFLKEEAELLHRDVKFDGDLKTVVTNHVLINHPGVVATPHNAFNSGEAVKRILNTTIENVVNYKLGKPKNTLK
jgi:D-lactate dehydrogenase